MKKISCGILLALGYLAALLSCGEFDQPLPWMPENCWRLFFLFLFALAHFIVYRVTRKKTFYARSGANE